MSCKKKVSIAAGNNAIPGTSSTGTFREPAIYVEQEGEKRSSATARPPPLIPLISVPDFKTDDDAGGNAATYGDAVIELRDLDLVSYDAQSASSCDSDTVIEVETVRAAAAVTTTTTSSKLVRTREPVRFTAPPNTETSLSVLSERSDDEECPDDKRDKRKDGASPATTTTVVTVEPDNASGKRRSNEIVLSPLQLGQN